MSFNADNLSSRGGILIHCNSKSDLDLLSKNLKTYLNELRLSEFIDYEDILIDKVLYLNLQANLALCQVTPKFDTKYICKLIDNNVSEKIFLFSEIILSMLRSPVPYIFLNYDQFIVSVLFRFNTAIAAKKTRIAFATETAERPLNYWNYSINNGYLLNDNVCLDDAVIATIHPPIKGQHYTFSCSRACEYVLLLSLALTLKDLNPKLLLVIEDFWRKKALMNTEFNDAFLCEHGSYDSPLPVNFYVPGDRVWFKNPDEYSSNITGFEGSWVIYLGSGLFCNFWDHTKPTSLDLKCVEVYHWRHGAELNSHGELFMNEPYVATCVESTLSDVKMKNEVISKMMIRRDRSGVHANGFVDASRDGFRAIDRFKIC